MRRKGNCARRSFIAGLRWCGINDKVPWFMRSEYLEKISSKYGLEYIRDETGFSNGNNPVLAVYKDNFKYTTAEYHGVFCSDIAPLLDKEVIIIVVGWEKLRKRNLKENKL